jgi:hypothetical protein
MLQEVVLSLCLDVHCILHIFCVGVMNTYMMILLIDVGVVHSPRVHDAQWWHIEICKMHICTRKSDVLLMPYTRIRPQLSEKRVAYLGDDYCTCLTRCVVLSSYKSSSLDELPIYAFLLQRHPRRHWRCVSSRRTTTICCTCVRAHDVISSCSYTTYDMYINTRRRGECVTWCCEIRITT